MKILDSRISGGSLKNEVSSLIWERRFMISGAEA